MERITIKQLEMKIDYLNKITNSPSTPYVKKEGGGMQAQIGNYHLSQAYGSVCVHRMSNEHGGVTTPIMFGHVPKREAFEALSAYIAGIEAGKELVA